MNKTTELAYYIVIPARFDSERLPGKMLLEVGGKTLIQHTWERASQSGAIDVVIATDDRRILEVAVSFGANAVMTAGDHQSGSDRIAECAGLMGWRDEDLIVNLQGDEPLMPPACLDQVARLLDGQSESSIASLYWPISDAGEVTNPNAVKVVTDCNEKAMYFSRSPIPFARGYTDVDAALGNGIKWKRHLGLYAYRLAALKAFTAAAPSSLEKAERLEQLRLMEQGGSIIMAEACEFIPAGVDTQEDLDRVRSFLK